MRAAMKRRMKTMVESFSSAAVLKRPQGLEKLLNPSPDEPRAYIKVLEPENLILMDIEYEGIKFQYDDYACERFRRYLVDTLLNHQKTYAIKEIMLNSLFELCD